jgi:hypothetical protein
MIIGLNVQQDFDESKKYAVEYLSCLKGYTGKRNVVPKSQVLPYGELNEWNPELMKQYLGKLHQDDNVTELERQKEELYLQKVVKVASERQIAGHEAEREPLDTLPPSEMDVESDVAVRVPTTSSMMADMHKTEPIKAGDAIEYYHTMSKAGDKDALTQAVVLSVEQGNQPLRLHNDEVLPASHSVKRIFTRIRGKFMDLRPTASYRAIRSYKLIRSELKANDPLRQKFGHGTSLLEAVLERNLSKFEQKLNDDGCGAFMDMMAWKPKITNRKDAVGKKLSKRTKLDPASSAVDDPETPFDKEGKSGGEEAITKLKLQLTRIRSLSGRQRVAASHMTEDMLELAILVQQKLMSPGGIDVEALAEQLELSDYALKRFLAGDEGKLIRLSQHEETVVILQQWVKDSNSV